MKKCLLPLSILLVFVAVTITGCKKNHCKTISCNGGGSCSEGVCQCDWLHEGEFCEIEKRAKYFGSFVGREACTSRNHLDYVNISAVEDSAHQLNFHNLYGSDSDIAGNMLADATVSIPEQWLPSGIISGSASIINEKIVINFLVTDGVTSDTCTWTQLW
jgi:hypothetical protein